MDELDGRFCELPKSSAALFCYFNSLDLFHKYLDNFKGNRYSFLGEIPHVCWYFHPSPGFCVILIGPKDGQRHCEPEPRYLEEECGDAWRLYVRTFLPHKSYSNQKLKFWVHFRLWWWCHQRKMWAVEIRKAWMFAQKLVIMSSQETFHMMGEDEIAIYVRRGALTGK